MANFVRIGRVEDFPEGQGRIVSAARKPVAVFKVEGKLYAVNNICPHMGGPIGAGGLEGMVVACPYHALRFHLDTGRSADEFDHSLQTYSIKVEDGEVWIDAWWAKKKAG